MKSALHSYHFVLVSFGFPKHICTQYAADNFDAFKGIVCMNVCVMCDNNYDFPLNIS